MGGFQTPESLKEKYCNVNLNWNFQRDGMGDNLIKPWEGYGYFLLS